MERTKRRPVADGRLSPREALVFATVLSAAGLVWLALAANLLATAVAAATLITYVWLYTPLKRRTSFATVIGALPGALPPMIGWAAAADTLSREAWILFAIVFFWQMPHFLAIAWLFRDDYGRAGFPMLPVSNPTAAAPPIRSRVRVRPAPGEPDAVDDGALRPDLFRRGAAPRPRLPLRESALRRPPHAA